MRKLVECVPNFSEGRNPATLERLRQAIAGTPGAFLLDWSADADHNRSVFTFAAEPKAAVEALLRGARVAVETIDLRRHKGVHPRIGALDVAPFVPLGETSWEEAIDAARSFGEKIWSELNVPVCFYGRAATRTDRVKLEEIRRGQFEELRDAALADERRRPDIGGPGLHPSAGAVAVGVRKYLVAFNVNLATGDVAVARRVAARVRASSGGLPEVKALGLKLDSAGLTQVSMNLTDYEATPVEQAFDRVAELAQAEGVDVAGGELIGLMPREALLRAGAHHLGLGEYRSEMVLEERLEEAFRAADEDKQS